MGEIWLAEDSVLACQVAVKLVAGHLRLDTRTLERFQQEARASAKVASPHVVRVLDHGTFEGRPYIVMELLAGEDLAARLRRVGVLPPSECARIVSQACRGLASVHDAGLVHRDVKPDNLFLVDDGGGDSFVKLLDFGLAAEVRARITTATGESIVGTPCYMSPEHTEGMRALVPQSDMWSLAVVAYEAVTGSLPFDGDGLIALAVAIADARFEPPSVHQPQLPPALDAFFLRAFAPAPGDRYRNATEMATAFTRAVGVASDPSLTTSLAVQTPVPKPAPRRNVALIAGASAVILAAAAGAVLGRTGGPATTSPASSVPSMTASVVTTEPAKPAPPVPSASSATVIVGPVASSTLAHASLVPAPHAAPRSAASVPPVHSAAVISLSPSARPADTGGISTPRRERGF